MLFKWYTQGFDIVGIEVRLHGGQVNMKCKFHNYGVNHFPLSAFADNCHSVHIVDTLEDFAEYLNLLNYLFETLNYNKVDLTAETWALKLEDSPLYHTLS